MVQFIGLSEKAKALVTMEPILIHTNFILRKYPDGKEENIVTPFYRNPITIDTGDQYFYTDFSDTENYLDVYSFPDGKKYYEYVQDTYWSSGPMIFTAFKDENGNIIEDSLWNTLEMQSQI